MGKFKLPTGEDIKQEAEKGEETKGSLKVGAGLLSEASKKLVVMETVNIPREQIKKNPKNKYSITGIPALAESIKQYGLVQPLHVAPKKDGAYLLLGGERRLTAIDLLIEDDSVTEWTADTLIPCVIKGIDDVKLDLSEENKERYAIITTNKEGRVYTDGDTYMELQEWKKIIEELREKGIEYIDHYDEEGNADPLPIKGNTTRNILAQATGMSRGQVNKFETVHNKGSESLKNALLDGKISVSAAEKAAKEMTEEEQDQIAGEAEKGKKLTAADVMKQKADKSKVIISPNGFRKDIKKISARLKEKEIILDGSDAEKYHFYIRQIENLLGVTNDL